MFSNIFWNEIYNLIMENQLKSWTICSCYKAKQLKLLEVEKHNDVCFFEEMLEIFF
jgi:hypothetical protein